MMYKNCKNCFWSEKAKTGNCPVMEEPSGKECFAWVKDKEDWANRIAACRKYMRGEHHEV